MMIAICVTEKEYTAQKNGKTTNDHFPTKLLLLQRRKVEEIRKRRKVVTK